MADVDATWEAAVVMTVAAAIMVAETTIAVITTTVAVTGTDKGTDADAQWKRLLMSAAARGQ